jgi:hypothetical protein
MAQVSRLAKLRAMPSREIASRVAYTGYLAYERARHRRGQLATPDRLRTALLPQFAHSPDWQKALTARAPAARFFAGLEAPERMRSLFHQRYASELDKARGTAMDVTRGRIGFFGRTFSFGPTIDWHADPVTGAHWPRAFHADVPVHGGNTGYGDVKDVWEINRHQFFVDLAKIAFLDRSSLHADALQRLVEHWMIEVPYATGAAWACALEPAFRAWSWLWAYHFMRAADMLDPEPHLVWLTGFYDHGRFLHRHLERYSSPYNHLIGEASALFALGLLFPEFREAGRWVERGRHVLEATVSDQFHTDGGTVEQSTFYHHATLGFYLLAAVLGSRNRVALSRRVWDAIERGVAFSAALVQPDGRTPRIGGADDGKPIRLEQLPFWEFRPYQAIGAVLFDRADFRFVAARFWEDALWVLGPDGADAFERLDARAPATTAALPASGYYVVRSDWSADADYLCFDCGEQAGGLRRDDVPSAAHGHADCLSVVVGLGGREVLVDPGFFCYNGDPQWEVHFRKTAAHNTVVVDGRDQAHHVSKMAWTRTYTHRAEGWSPQGLGWALGSHDGYARGENGVTHRRTAWLRPDGYVVIRDELSGTPGHTAAANFQFAPGELRIGEGSATLDDRYVLSWVCSAPIEASATCGGEGPDAGWIARSLGVRVAAPRLTLEFTMSAPKAVLLTVLVDRRRHPGGVQVTAGSLAPRLLEARISAAGFVDEVTTTLDGAVTSPGLMTDAPLVIVRREAGRVIEALQAGGTHVAVSATSPPQTARPIATVAEALR